MPLQRLLRVGALSVIACLGSSPATSTERNSAQGRPFTVEDSIKMGQVVPLERISTDPEIALFSPDKKYFLMTVKRGDVLHNAIVWTVYAFNTASVVKYVNSNGSGPPRPERIISIEDVDAGGMTNPTWIHDDAIEFLFGGPHGHRQVFRVSLRQKVLKQVTRDPDGVDAFSASSDRLLYYSRAKKFRRSFVERVEQQSLFELLSLDGDPGRLRLSYLQGGHKVRAISTEGESLLPYFERSWLSPEGHWAIAFSPSTNAPEYWSAYEIPNHDVFGYTSQNRRSDPKSPDLAFKTRYSLVNLETGRVRSLLDAPSGFAVQTRTPLGVFWPAGGNSVIVSDTFLPLVRDVPDQAQRRLAPAIAEVNLSTGAATPIVFEPVPTPDKIARKSFEPISSISWDPVIQGLTVSYRKFSGETYDRLFVKRNGNWHEASKVDAPSEAPLKIYILESPNQRPLVYVHGTECDRDKLLFDPAPEAESYEFGRATTVHWTDRNGLTWSGSLITPPRYDARRKYPLVVQTHGFNPGEFLVDGPGGITSGMAARALSSAGIAVLQIELQGQLIGSPDEADREAEGIRAGVQTLIDGGRIDRANVGLIAFSRSILWTIPLLVKNPTLFRAVDISDGVWWGYLNRVLSVNGNRATLSEIEKATGGEFQLESLGSWIDRNPMYQLPRSRAAIRLEANGERSLIAMWEYYSVLKAAHRPVDLVYFPLGEHNLSRPLERIGSQGGNVDWFRFWLQNYQYPEPSKTAEYADWTALRSLQSR